MVTLLPPICFSKANVILTLRAVLSLNTSPVSLTSAYKFWIHCFTLGCIPVSPGEGAALLSPLTMLSSIMDHYHHGR